MALSDEKGRNFLGVTGVELGSEAPCSLVLLILMTLDSVRERPSILRARLLWDFCAERDGPATESAVAKEKISERSFAEWCKGGEWGNRTSSWRTEVVTERAKGRLEAVSEENP